MSNYRQACGPHSVFTLSLTPALRHGHSTSLRGWVSTHSKVKVCWEKLCSQFLNSCSCFIFRLATQLYWTQTV